MTTNTIYTFKTISSVFHVKYTNHFTFAFFRPQLDHELNGTEQNHDKYSIRHLTRLLMEIRSSTVLLGLISKVSSLLEAWY